MDPDLKKELETADVLSNIFKDKDGINGNEEPQKKLDKRSKEYRNMAMKNCYSSISTDATKSNIDDIQLFADGLKLVATSRQAKTEKELQACVAAAHEFVKLVKNYTPQ